MVFTGAVCVFFPHREILSGDPILHVPSVIPELTTHRVFTSELVHGEPVDKCSGLTQKERNKASFWQHAQDCTVR